MLNLSVKSIYTLSFALMVTLPGLTQNLTYQEADSTSSDSLLDSVVHGLIKFPDSIDLKSKSDINNSEYKPHLKTRMEFTFRYREPHDTVAAPMSLSHPRPRYLMDNFKGLETVTEIDFIGRKAVLYTTIGGVEIWSHYYLELDEYIRYSNNRLFGQVWYDENEMTIPESQKIKKRDWLDIEIPIKLPAWARRVVGEGGPRLTITGSVKFTFGGESRWQPDKTNVYDSNSKIPTLKADTEMNFSIRGRIGRLIDVTIDQDNKGDIGESLKKQLKIHYKGEGDELEDNILQELVAGNTQLPMPNINFSGYSHNHSGLFGLKARWKIGDLDITSIASLEEGSAESKSFNATGTETTDNSDEIQIREFTYFFLDTMFYRFRETTNLTHGYEIKDLKVYLSERQTSSNIMANSGIVWKEYKDPDNGNKISSGAFRQLKKNFDYKYYPEYCYISLEQRVNENQLLAVSYVLKKRNSNEIDTIIPEEDPKLLKNEATFDSTSNLWKYAWRNVYYIGSVDASSINSANIKIFQINAEGGDQEQTADGKYFTNVLGIADEKGIIYRDNPEIFNWEQGLLIFPEMEPFKDAEVLGAENTNPQLYSMEVDKFRNKGGQKKYNFKVTSKSRKSVVHLGVMNVLPGTEKIRLGPTLLTKNRDYDIDYEMGMVTFISPKVMQSNEEIKIDYEYAPYFIPESKIFLGTHLEWKLPDLGSESFIGAAALYKSERAASDQRAQLGKEPNSNALFDINARFAGKPEWMTALVNKIPLISTRQKSYLSLEGELAHSIVNPNTHNDALVDDFEAAEQNVSVPLGALSWHMASPPVAGRLYDIPQEDLGPYQLWGGDNFFWCNTMEDPKKIWTGIQTNVKNNQTSVLNLVAEPYEQTSVENRKFCWGGIMYPFYSGIGKQIELCKFIELWVWYPEQNKDAVLNMDIGVISEDIRISSVYNPSVNDSFSVINGEPNFSFDREFQRDTINGTIPDQLDESTDLGIDHRPDGREMRLVPIRHDTIFDIVPDRVKFFTDSAAAAAFAWDSLGYRTDPTAQELPVYIRKDADNNSIDTVPNIWNANIDTSVAGIDSISLKAWFPAKYDTTFPVAFDTITQGDAAGDNYSYKGSANSGNVFDYRFYMGTEHNSVGKGNQETRDADPTNEDSEDINRSLSTEYYNRYFHYTVPLQNSEFEVSRNHDGWHHVRIPIDAYTHAVGDPYLAKTNTIRIYVNNIKEKTAHIKFAKIELTGNKWQEAVKMKDTTDAGDSTFKVPDTSWGAVSVAVINTENAEDYSIPEKLVPRIRNEGEDFVQKEQSLEIHYRHLAKDSSVLIYKNVSFQEFDFSAYRKLQIYVHGGKEMNDVPVDYFLRFGQDSANYYECSRPLIKEKWDIMKIDLNRISREKKAFRDRKASDSIAGDTIIQMSINNPGEAYTLRIKNSASFTRIKWMALGVKNISENDDDSANGVLWVNDLKVLDIKKQKGWASRMTFESKFADFLHLTTNLEYKDGSFLDLNQKNAGSESRSTLSSNISTTINADKFTPARWGITMPVTVGLRNNVTRPRYAPNSDVELLKDDHPDGIKEMVPQLVNDLAGREVFKNISMTPSSSYESRDRSQTFNTSFRKTTQSKNMLSNLTLDRLNKSYAFSNVFNKRSGTGAYDTTVSHSTSLDYNLNPRNPKKITPFGNMEIHWLWDTWNFTLYNGQYQKKHEIIPIIQNGRESGLSDIETKQFTLSHKTNMSWNFLQWDKISLSADYSLGLDRNFNDKIDTSTNFGSFAAKHVPHFTEKNDAFKSLWILEGEQNRSQNINYNVDLGWPSILPLSMSYGSNYTQRIKQQNFMDNMEMGMGNDFTARTNFNLNPLLEGGEKLGSRLKLKWLSTGFKGVSKFLNDIRFNGINFTYDASSKYAINGILNLDSSMYAKSDFYGFQMGFKKFTNGHFRGIKDVVLAQTSDPYRFGEYFYPGYSDESLFITTLAEGNSRFSNRRFDMNSSLNLFNWVNLSGGMGYRIEWNEYAKSETQGYRDTLFKISPDDSSIYHMGDTTVTFPDINYSLRFSRFYEIWKYVPVLGEKSSSAEFNNSGNYSRLRTRPFDAVKYNSKFSMNSTLKWKTRKNLEFTFFDKHDWPRNYEIVPALRADFNKSWEDSLGYRKTIQAKKAFKLIRWTFQFQNQLEVFGGIKYGRTYERILNPTVRDTLANLRDSVKNYSDIKTLSSFKNLDEIKPTKEESNFSLSSGFAYNFSTKIQGGGHLAYKRKKQKDVTTNTIDVEVFVQIRL
ncbi:MAG: cell surface protein SprA [bacterium]